MLKQQTKPFKNKNSKKTLNIGMVIFFIVILYLVFYLFSFSSKKHNVYEVTEGYTASKYDGQYTALALRSENVVFAPDSGYISFFVGDGTPVYVNQHSYLIDKSGEFSQRLVEAAKNQALLNENDLTVIKNSIYDFDTSFNPANYYETYNFKYKIESQILELINSSVFDNDRIRLGSYNVYNSEIAGIVVHYIDGFESTNADSIQASSFRRTEYEKNIIKTNDYVEIGSPIYKVITSDNWYLVIQVLKPELFENLDAISIEFLKDNIKVDGKFKLKAIAGNYYGFISLDKYMVRYISDRYIQISVVDDAIKGLLIPKTSVCAKTFYAIPVEFMTMGGNSSMDGFMKKNKPNSSDNSVTFVTPEIIYQNEEYCYVSTDAFKEGDILKKTDSDKIFPIGITESLCGAYISDSNNIYFKLVDILGENNGYYVISNTTDNGIKIFDQVIINGADVSQ